MKKLIVIIIAALAAIGIDAPARSFSATSSFDSICAARGIGRYDDGTTVIKVPVKLFSPPLRPANVQLPHKVNSSNWVSPYALPYTRHSTGAAWHRMWINTAVLSGAFVGTLFVLELLPEDATAWNRAAISQVPMFKRWFRNVFKKGPEWDHDNPIFNYVLHPYAGAAYFMAARSCGFSFWGSMLYSAAISTVGWEFGIEAFMERPSYQDIVITPVVGSLIGEMCYKGKRAIVDRGYELFGSPVLGHAACFLLDPVNEVIELFRGTTCSEIARRNKVHGAFAPSPHGFAMTIFF
ncbi:MAG: DUF3943 domain-containing protein [Muribaculaceae bacterium]|nr:DUF3943 domain-containing protein [Muribaculaceae bacterium]